MPQTSSKKLFLRFSKTASCWAGKPATFAAAVAVVFLWSVSGPLFDFSDTWQLVINTGTTIITFLIVFLIQNTQNRDTKAIQLKLDELIRATKGAHTVFLDLEELSEEELDKICERYEDIARKARLRLKAGKSDTNVPRVLFKTVRSGR